MLIRMVPLVIAALAALGCGSARAADGLAVGTRAPDFALKSVTGETVTLSALLKKDVVLLNFWFHG